MTYYASEIMSGSVVIFRSHSSWSCEYLMVHPSAKSTEVSVDQPTRPSWLLR